MIAALFVACTSESASDTTEPDRGARLASTSPGETSGTPDSAAASPTADARRARLPEVPAARQPAALASQIDLAAAILRQPHPAAADVLRAGRFQQLAVRVLATATDAFRRRVMARLEPETERTTRLCVEAARLLRGITAPQQSLPRWRIVAPPPPAELRNHYRRAQRRTGVPWTYLAAIHLVETRMGRIRGASTAGALGPMQFLPPTWEMYGAGGDINDPRDAILAAARLLRANGAPGDMAEALWHYNPSDSYVGAVSRYARTLQRSPSAYLGFWHWRVLYRHVRGTYVLPVGYPGARPQLLPES